MKHPVRSNDSYVAIEECLKIFKREEVDFVIQAGDLFHDMYPSQDTMLTTMKIFQKYVSGTRSNSVDFDLYNFSNPNF